MSPLRLSEQVQAETCSCCGRPYAAVWMLLWRPQDGHYDAICRKCADVILLSSFVGFTGIEAEEEPE